jgi:hypothetical protein
MRSRIVVSEGNHRGELRINAESTTLRAAARLRRVFDHRTPGPDGPGAYVVG